MDEFIVLYRLATVAALAEFPYKYTMTENVDSFVVRNRKIVVGFGLGES